MRQRWKTLMNNTTRLDVGSDESPHGPNDNQRRAEQSEDTGVSVDFPVVATAMANATHSSSFLTPVIWCILVTETAERFAYYGFRAVLVLYFLNSLGYKETTAIALYGYHGALCNFTPLIGAYLADAYLGRYHTILVFALIYVAGLVVLVSAAASSSSSPTDDVHNTQIVSFLGLFLVGLGTGGIKPCVSAFGADQISCLAPLDVHRDIDDTQSQTFEPHQAEHYSPGVLVLPVPCPVVQDDATGNERQSLQNAREYHVRAFFNYFYFCINVGAVASIAVVPLIRSRFGFAFAFGLPCLCMIAALGMFVSKRHAYVYQPITANTGRSSVLTTLFVTWWLVGQKLSSYRWFACPCLRVDPGHAPTLLATSESADDEATPDTSRTFHAVDTEMREPSPLETTRHKLRHHHHHDLEDATQLLRILPILAVFPIYGCLYDQQGSVWTLQATRMYLPYGIQAEQLNMINPVQIMLLIPLFDRIIYPYMERRSWNISPLKRMSWGMLLTAIAFSTSGFVESAIQHSEAHGLPKVNVGWQLPQITILAVGEIFLSVTGLEFTYATSPPRLKAFATALYLCTTGIGDAFAGILYSTIFAYMNRATVMHLCATMMIGNLFLFVFVSRSYEEQGACHETGGGDSQRSIRGKRDTSGNVELPCLPGVMT